MLEKSQVLGEQRFCRRDGDRIEVRAGGRAVEVESCRLFYQGRQLCSGRERMDLGERSMTGYLAGRALRPPVRNGRVRLGGVYDFRLAVRPKKRVRGEPEWLEWQCRITQRQPELWSFVVHAEVIRAGLPPNPVKKRCKNVKTA